MIAADRKKVWDALNDAEILRASIPGCSALTGNVQDGFQAVVTQKIGPIRATFKGTVTLSDIVEGQSYRIDGEGSGGAAGLAKGGADISLADMDGGTELNYSVNAMVGGKLAGLGGRLIDSVAKKLADQFFANFQTLVEPTQAEDETDSQTKAAAL